MAYVDADFYEQTYQGTPIADADEFDRLAKRASEQIDQLTDYQIGGPGLESWPPILAERIRNAAAAQVEYLNEFGITESNFSQPPPQSVAIGKFNITPGAAGAGLAGSKYSPGMIEYLRSAGLLYAGVDVISRGYNGY